MDDDNLPDFNQLTAVSERRIQETRKFIKSSLVEVYNELQYKTSSDRLFLYTGNAPTKILERETDRMLKQMQDKHNGSLKMGIEWKENKLWLHITYCLEI